MAPLRDKFRVGFKATELEARSAIAETSGRLRAAGVPSARADEIEIALAEAINNVVEHAFAGNKFVHIYKHKGRQNVSTKLMLINCEKCLMNNKDTINTIV